MPHDGFSDRRDMRNPDLFRPELYTVEPVHTAKAWQEYVRFLEMHYEALGFETKCCQPREESTLYSIRFREELAAIFRLTEITDSRSVYYRLVPGAERDDGSLSRLLEVNNVVIARAFRASAVLGLLLYTSACVGHEQGYQFVVGLNRFQILRYFVDFGVVPAEHAPEYVLGKDHLQDFVNYYNTGDQASVDYMHERARRYFHQEYTMSRLREKYVRPAHAGSRHSRRPPGVREMVARVTGDATR